MYGKPACRTCPFTYKPPISRRAAKNRAGKIAVTCIGAGKRTCIRSTGRASGCIKCIAACAISLHTPSFKWCARICIITGKWRSASRPAIMPPIINTGKVSAGKRIVTGRRSAGAERTILSLADLQPVPWEKYTCAGSLRK